MSNHDMPNLNDHTNSIKKQKLKKKKLSESYNKIYLLEMQALRNGFGKMVKSNYQTSPQYSFTKSEKFLFNSNCFGFIFFFIDLLLLDITLL